MDISIILMIVGILCIIISFFMKDKTKVLEKELEDLSINVFQETNSLKRRLKVVEEELLLDHNFQVKSPNLANEGHQVPQMMQQPAHNAQPKQDPMTTFKQVAAQVKAQQAVQTNTQPVYTPPQAPLQPQQKPIHSILVNQVLELNKQGLSIDEICRLSTLSQDQVRSILASNGGI